MSATNAATQLHLVNEEEPQKSILLEREHKSIHGEIIAKIISSHYYVHKDIYVDDLADELNGRTEIFAIGVVDDEMRAVGIILRRELFDILGKPYGRDLYKNKTLVSVMQRAREFNYTRNIFSVSEEIQGELNAQQTEYYVVRDNSDAYAGIFSSKDMLVYLSDMTQKDIALAKRLQSSIVLEERMESHDTFNILGASRMAKGVGGDYYSFQQYAENKWILSVCDVSGKGISAAFISVIMGGMESIFDFNSGLRKYIRKLNNYIFSSFMSEKFLTGIFVDFNDATGEAVLYNMGHSYSFIFRQGRLIKLKSRVDSHPLGITPDIDPRGSVVTLEKDDILILITDGIDEQKDPEGEEYGLQRFFTIISKYRNTSLQKIKNVVYEDVQKFKKNQPQQDDMTLVFLQYKGQ